MGVRLKGVQESFGLPTCRTEEYDRKDVYIDSKEESKSKVDR